MSINKILRALGSTQNVRITIFFLYNDLFWKKSGGVLVKSMGEMISVIITKNY
jgi:hypothetical protein